MVIDPMAEARSSRAGLPPHPSAPILVLSYWNLNHIAFGGGRRIEALLQLLGSRAWLIQPAPPHPRWRGEVFRPNLGRRKVGINWGLFHFFLPWVSDRVRRAVVREQPAVIVLTSIWAYVPFRRMEIRPPIVLDAHDVLAQAIAERFGRSHPWTRMVEAWERRVTHAADEIIACSETDAAVFRLQYGLPPDRVHVVPNGTDLDHAARAHAALPPEVASALHEVPTVLFFMGKLDYQPNRVALEFLSHTVLPELERRMPGRFRLLVTGGPIPTGRWHPAIIWAGRVPDVAPYLERATVCLAPIFTGSGTRLKVLEYMAAAKPVIATAKAVEGLAVESGHHALIVEPQEFAEAIVRVANDPEMARRLGNAGRALVASRYSWDAIRQQWRKILEPYTGPLA
jgi:glycosyltransferase involved in cell wall biosynthesis